MAVLKLNNVTTITESSGSLTLANAALGTPTSGVMTNMTGTPSAITLTNATFPAGHVINTITASFAGNTNSEAGTTDWQDTGISLDVTAAEWSGGSKIYVIANAGFSFSGSYLNYKLERTLPTTAVDLCIYTFGVTTSGTWQRNGFTLSGMDTSLGSGTHTYKVRFHRHNETVYYMSSGGGDEGLMTITAMVIK